MEGESRTKCTQDRDRSGLTPDPGALCGLKLPPSLSALLEPPPYPRWSGPPNEEKRTLEGESRTNVPRTDCSGPDASALSG